MRKRAHDWIWRKAAQSAERAKLHRIAEIRDKRDLLLRFNAGSQLVERFDATRRTDTTRRTLAAAFHRTELHGETCHLQHIGTVVKNDNTGMPDQAVFCGERLIVERCIEKTAREIGAERPAN